MSKTKSQQYDWEAIEKLYRADVLSLREIARQHGCAESSIRKRAKMFGWQKDLAGKVKEKVRNELVRSAVRTTDAKTDQEIVDAAAATTVELVRGHRNDIAKLQGMEQRLLAELGDENRPPTKLYITQYQGEIVQKEVGLTVSERASTLRDLSTVQHKRIQLERQAFNLGEETGGEIGSGSIAEELRNVKRTLEGME